MRLKRVSLRWMTPERDEDCRAERSETIESGGGGREKALCVKSERRHRKAKRAILVLSCRYFAEILI